MTDSRNVKLPSSYTHPPCPRCAYYDQGVTTTLCKFKPGEDEPIFYASLKNGPEFKCYREKENARNRPDPI